MERRQVRPHVFRTQWHPEQRVVHYEIMHHGAPWAGHEPTTARPRKHLKDLHAALLARYPARIVETEDESITLYARITCIVILHESPDHAESRVVWNVLWEDADGGNYGGEQENEPLAPEQHARHVEHARAVASKIKARLRSPEPFVIERPPHPALQVHEEGNGGDRN